MSKSILKYRYYSKFSFKNFKTGLDNALQNCSRDYKEFEYIFKPILKKYAPKKKKIHSG